MSGLTNLQKRINYRGGAKQVDRMIEEKRNSLSKALLYSYQSATAVLEDGRKFRCLINPNKISMELDDKMLSIPFRDICLNKKNTEGDKTSAGKENIGITCGSVIEWEENGTHWIVYSQYLQETAYFRGLMRQCAQDPVEINGRKYWYYLKGPDEKGIDLLKTKNLIFNNLNYTLEMYISKTKETEEFFHRFTKINIPFKNSEGKIEYRPYEVQATDGVTTAGIITVYLKEDYSNKWAPTQAEDENSEPSVEEPTSFMMQRASAPSIKGPAQVYPYDIISYSIEGLDNAFGSWSLSNKRARIIEQTNSYVKIEITTGKSGNISLIYHQNRSIEDIIYNIEILPL